MIRKVILFRTLRESRWQEGAGSLVLLAAAEESGLVQRLTEAVPSSNKETTAPRLADSRASTRQQLMLTLLFMNLVGVRRTWDLRSYSGDGLGLLSGRARAYGYAHSERFLAQLAAAGGAGYLTDTLARWTSHLWKGSEAGASAVYYVDGHRKAVYSDSLLPRGLVGRTGKILGCRALTLLHDAQGHPRLVLTARGDQHLTIGLPLVVAHYEQAVGQRQLAQVIVDREGMSAPFLKQLSAERTVITLLRTDQYDGLDSFTQVGAFIPLAYDRDGVVVREVAPAQFSLPLPAPPHAVLPLSVALVRDWRRQTTLPVEAVSPTRWDADLDSEQRWWDGQWVATPAPSLPTQPKLIPVVSTARTSDAVGLAQTYFHRWAAQENIIRDFLIPLGLDTNHGYAKTPVENSEVAKRRAALQKRLDHCRVWADKAYRKHDWNAKRGDKLWKEAKAYSDEQYRQLNRRLSSPEHQALPRSEWRALLKQATAQIDPEIHRRFHQAQQTLHRADQAWRKYEQYCALQRDLLRACETLTAQERTMYELDNAKDQIMTVCKVALANLLMWVRDRFFPLTYAHATAERLLPFEEMLLPRPYFLDQRPRFVDFDLYGILANFLYSGHYRLPSVHTHLRKWHRRMTGLRVKSFACEEELHS